MLSRDMTDHPKEGTDEHGPVLSLIPVFIVIAVIALIDNSMVVFLLMRNRSWLKKAHSNLILNLAATDILTAICILTVPSFIHDQNTYPVPQGPTARELYCRLVWSHYIVFSLGVTSVYTCLFLAIERWLAIARPHAYRKYTHLKLSKILMVSLPWLVGFTFQVSTALRSSGVTQADGTTPSCQMVSLDRSARVAVALVSFCAIILLPGILVVAIYMDILLKANSIRRSASQRGSIKKSKRDFKRITLMAGLASIALIICWLPDQTYSMLAQMGYVAVHGGPHRWLNVLALFNTCLNPFIYAFSNSEYRTGFKKELAMLICCKRGPPPRQYSLNDDRPDELRDDSYTADV